MVKTAAAVFFVASLACRAAAQEKPPADAKSKIAFTVKEVPAEGKTGPFFRCEGEADLPDGSRVDVYYYFGAIVYGQEIDRGAVLVKDRKFSRDSTLYPKRTLPGVYGVRALFNPGLQPREEFQTLPRCHTDQVLKIGTDAEIEREQNSVRKRMAEYVEAIRALGDEIAAKQKEAAGKLDKQGWTRLVDGWRERCLAVEGRAHKDRDFLFLGLMPVADMGLEQMRNILIGVAHCAAAGQALEMKEGLTRLDLSARKFTEMIAVRPDDPKKLRLELAGEARKMLREAAGLEGPALSAAQRKFLEAVFRLNPHVPEAHRESVLAIASSARGVFEAIGEKKDNAQELREKLDGQLEALLRALEEGK